MAGAAIRATGDDTGLVRVVVCTSIGRDDRQGVAPDHVAIGVEIASALARRHSVVVIALDDDLDQVRAYAQTLGVRLGGDPTEAAVGRDGFYLVGAQSPTPSELSGELERLITRHWLPVIVAPGDSGILGDLALKSGAWPFMEDVVVLVTTPSLGIALERTVVAVAEISRRDIDVLVVAGPEWSPMLEAVATAGVVDRNALSWRQSHDQYRVGGCPQAVDRIVEALSSPRGPT